jgi:hypothetical protein
MGLSLHIHVCICDLEVRVPFLYGLIAQAYNTTTAVSHVHRSHLQDKGGFGRSQAAVITQTMDTLLNHEYGYTYVHSCGYIYLIVSTCVSLYALVGQCNFKKTWLLVPNLTMYVILYCHI